ncbi:efflux RND transporter periplasmic adaptor subunit [Tundrisphaera sp. TA3]|uniref:efflux RND transporter periplasmic adaptor subunit n=1 Tax=Tundrisphaera sp. TA3 TaxID=3435775 RepID=UPI003EBBCC5D
MTATASAPVDRRAKRPARWLKPALLLAAIAAVGIARWRYPEETEKLWHAVAGAAKKPAPAPAPPEPKTPFDGTIRLTEKARAAMGIRSAAAKPQEHPLRLELLGTTEYISDTLTKVRPMFKGRVDKVHVTVGQSVKRGEPLVELYSTELAEAKRACEIERIQWQYDKNLLAIREALLASKTISQQLYDETKNNEMKNRHEYEVARDKLLVYGLTEEEVERVEHEPGAEKARLTLRSPADGLVIARDVAVGNLYDENDTLLVIAPLDRLWVWGNVFESDLDLVQLGQDWEIGFPFLNHKLRGKVEYISNRVDPATHAVRVRTSIPNDGGRLKSDMLVRGVLEIPPVDGRVVIPRPALIVGDGHSMAFVESASEPGRYERRPVAVVQETDDRVVISEGVRPGEKVVTVGGLLLAQMFEDAQTVASGEAATATPEVH